MDPILFLGYIRLFLLLCLVLNILFSPFLFHTFLFLLCSNIHLSYSDVFGSLCLFPKPFYFIFCFYFFPIFIVYSQLFFFTSFPLIFLILLQSSTFPPLSCLISSTIFSLCFLISFFISSLNFIFCSLYLSQINFFLFL